MNFSSRLSRGWDSRIIVVSTTEAKSRRLSSLSYRVGVSVILLRADGLVVVAVQHCPSYIRLVPQAPSSKRNSKHGPSPIAKNFQLSISQDKS